MMLSEDARELAYELRLNVGPDSVGIGPDVNGVMALVTDMEPASIAIALSELERIGFIRLDRAIATQDRPEPLALRGIVGVAVLEPLQEHFDRLGL